jgi:hypothetical protein
VPGTEIDCTEVSMKATQPRKPVATTESKNEPTDREPAALHEQGGKRPRPARRRVVPGTENGCTEAPMKATQHAKPVATTESKNKPTDREPSVRKRPRPAWRRVVPGTENGCTEVAMKARQPIKPVATAESKNEPDREPSVLHEQAPRRARRRSTVIYDDWAQLERRHGDLKVALLPWVAPTTHGTNTTQETEPVAGSKYQPTPYEHEVLAKQAQRLNDQVRVPRIQFVEDQRGGRREFDHPDQAIAFALLKEAFGTADDQFANGLISYLCTALAIDESSAFEFPRADALNYAISFVAAGKAVDEFDAEILAHRAVCRIIIERLLRNLREPLRFDLSDELKFAVQHYKYSPKDQIDREVKIDRRPVVEFSVRLATKLMTTCVELMARADRRRATVELSRKMQQRSAVTPVEASLGEIKHATPNARPKKAKAVHARGLNGSAVTKLPQKTVSTMARKGNGHTPT